jgi:hypothetical protein
MVKGLTDLLEDVDSAFNAESLVPLASGWRSLALLEALERLTRHDAAKLQKLAALSYSHVNGFRKLVIASHSREGPQIRLHIWDGATIADQTHSHSWDFASVVLFGRLRVSRNEVVPGSGHHTLWSLPNLASKAAGQRVTQAGSAVGIRDTHDMVLEPGGVHHLNAGMFHSVQNLSESGTCTLLLQSRHRLPVSWCVSEDADEPPSAYTVSYFRPDEYLGYIADILLRFRVAIGFPAVA